jgi:arylsulfatase A-like enzyme
MNIVLLILDALRYDYVNHENTPNLMKLAEEGVCFTNASSGNSSTIVSMPYILSGQKSFDPKMNIAALLNMAGFHTALVHSNPIVHEFYTGFKETIDIKSKKFRMSKSWKRTLRNNLPPKVIAGMKKFRATFYEDDDYLPYARSHETLEFSLKWMRNHSEYFLWIHIMEPHSPYYPINTSLNLTRQDMRNINDKLIESVHGNYEPTAEEIETAKTLYTEDIKEMDRELGYFFNSFNKDDLLVVTADHGEEFGEHGQFSHHADKFIPELIHVPLILFGGNIKAGLVIDKPVSTMSIGQTIMDSLGVDHQLGESVSIWEMIKA